MDSAGLIGRAIHADETGQPRMCELYIRNARRRLREEIAEQRRQRAALSFLQALLVARLDLLDDARPFVEFLDSYNRATQADYALIAGPSKGATP